jgi:hypothetical protein
MALVKCSECGTEISDKAAACVKCGAPVASGRPGAANSVIVTGAPSSSHPILKWIGVAVVVIFGYSFLHGAYRGYVDKANAQAQPTQQQAAADPDDGIPIPLSADQLKREYDANEVAADMRYKGKTLIVTGTIRSIDKDFLDHPVLNLDTDDQFTSVQAIYPKEAANTLAEFHKGQTVSLKCRGHGRVLLSPMLDCAHG